MRSEIDDYFAKFTYQPTPAVGTKPQEVVWKRVGELHVTGSRLYIGDSWAIRAESIEVPVSPGVYDIDAKCFSYGSDGRVAALRGRLQGSASDGMREAGQFGVDAASAGVIDADALDRWAGADEAAYEAWQQRFSAVGSSRMAGFFPCKAIGSAMLFTSTGFGDGRYRVVSLLERDKPVGFEARFLEDGQGYFDSGHFLDIPQRPGVKDFAKAVLAVPFAIIAIAVEVAFGLMAKALAKISKLFSGRTR